MAKLLRGMVKSAILAKAVQIVQRELSKPENQRKLKELWHKMTTRGQQPPAPAATRTGLRRVPTGMRRAPARG